MRKIVLFGTGKVGSDAKSFFGRDRIAALVDNDPDKWGILIEDIPVYSFSDYVANAPLRENDLVLSVGGKILPQIEKQLNEAGIHDYFFFASRAAKNVEEVKLYLNELDQYVLFGIDIRDMVIVDLLHRMNEQKIIGLCDFDDSESIGKQVGEYSVLPASEYRDSKVVFVILDSFYYAAADEYLRQLVSDEKRIINPYRKQGYFGGDLLVNPYSGKNAETTEQSWNANLDQSITIKAIDRYVEIVKKKVPLFRYIEIETYNRCNGTCSFCPVSKNIDPRPEHLMPRELFEKIIDDLASMDYKGELCTFSNNEPFLDDRIIELNAYARKKLPNARMHLYTNGTLLTLDKFQAIMEHLDELIIDNYRQDLKMIKPVQQIYDFVNEHDEYKGRVSIVLRKPVEILTSRGGDAPNRENIKSFPENSCALPFEQMIVRPDGKVSLCCNDPLGKNTLGDLNKQTLEEVWYGAPYTRIRELIASGRKNWDHCKNCDTFYIY